MFSTDSFFDQYCLSFTLSPHFSFSTIDLPSSRIRLALYPVIVLSKDNSVTDLLSSVLCTLNAPLVAHDVVLNNQYFSCSLSNPNLLDKIFKLIISWVKNYS